MVGDRARLSRSNLFILDMITYSLQLTFYILVSGKFSKIKLLKKDTISSPLDFRHTLTVRPSDDECSVKQLVAVAKDTPPGSPAIMRAIAREIRFLTDSPAESVLRRAVAHVLLSCLMVDGFRVEVLRKPVCVPSVG